MPYLRPYDVFDFMPSAADRLSKLRNSDLDRLTPAPGTILQTCSGRNLGPLTITDDTLAGFALSHDMVRIDVNDDRLRYWVLAFLKTATGQAILRRGRSGSVIDHITVPDIGALPLPMADSDVRRTVIKLMRRGIERAATARRDLLGLLAQVDATFPVPTLADPTREGWSQPARSIQDRLDAGFYEPRVVATRSQLAAAGAHRLGDLGEAKLPLRYKRYYVEADHGRPIMSGRQLLQFEPVNLRYVSDRSFRNPVEYEIRAGMTVFGAVGRSEGRQGIPALVTAGRDGWLASNDVMRLTPRPGVRPGALWLAVAAALTRLQINALSFGSVVDHMNPWDVEAILAPPIAASDALAAEKAWARFSSAAVDIADAVGYLEAFLAS